MRGSDYGKRQKMNHVIVPRHMRTIGLQYCPRSSSVVMLATPELQPELGGEGMNMRQLADKAVMGINFLKNDETKKVASELVGMLPSRTQSKIDSIVRGVSPRVVGALEEVYKRREDIKDIAKSVKGASGNGLSLAGGSCCEPCGSGSQMLPGDLLRKKLLAKVVRMKRMESLGDRLKTTAVGMGGSGLNIAGTSSGQSRSMTYPKMKDYKVNPRPLVGAGAKMKGQEGGFIILALSALIGAISAATASAMAVSIGTATVGSLVGAAATAGATAAGAVAGKKLIEKLAGDNKKGSGLKTELLSAVDKVRLTLQDLPLEAKQILLEGYSELKDNPSEKGLISLGVKLAPFARKAFATKVGKELGIGGSGLSLAGGSKEFTKRFVGAFVSKLIK